MKKNFKDQKNTHQGKGPSSTLASVRASAFGAGAGLICLSLLLFACAIICLLSNDPHTLLAPLSLFCIYASAFASGFIGAKKNRSCALLICGILCGIGYILMLSLILFILNISLLSDSAKSSSLWLRALCLPASVLGALCSASRSSPKKHRRY